MTRRVGWIIFGIVLIDIAIVLSIYRASFGPQASAVTYNSDIWQTLIIDYGNLITTSLIVAGAISLFWGSRKISVFNLSNNLKKTAKLTAKSLPVCSTCHKTLLYVSHNQAWYCFECKKYKRSPVTENRIRTDVLVKPISIRAETKNSIQIKEPQPIQPAKIQDEKPKNETITQEKQPTIPLQEPATDVFVCPRNLEYFNQHPRPKQIPAECISCQQLIECVCITST